MEFHRTVADLSPAELFGLLVLALYWVGMIVFAARAYKDLDNRARVMFWLCMAFAVVFPAYLGIMALSPSGL